MGDCERKRCQSCGDRVYHSSIVSETSARIVTLEADLRAALGKVRDAEKKLENALTPDPWGGMRAALEGEKG